MGSKHEGHSTDGFFSLAHGFLPEIPPIDHLPPQYGDWDQLAKKLPEIVRNNKVSESISTLSEMDVGSIDERYLCRLASLIGIFAHAVVREHQLRFSDETVDIPLVLLTPWEQVAKRLNRPQIGLTYGDLILVTNLIYRINLL